MPKPQNDFRAVQAAFAAYIRDPRSAPRPKGVPLDRINAYRDLFFNNIESFIATGFPVLRSVLPDPEWQALIRDFFALHRCRTPLFVGIAEEFVDWLESRPSEALLGRRFLPELARHEWVELALSTQEGECPPLSPDFEDGLEERQLCLSPLAVIRAYTFPVHRIGPDHQPVTPPKERTFLLAYRDREDLVQFIEFNEMSFSLLEALATPNPKPLRAILSDLAERIGHPDRSLVIGFGQSLAASLHQKGVLGRNPA